MEGGDNGPRSSTPAEDVPPVGLTVEEYAALRSVIEAHHRYDVGPGQCSSIVTQRIRAPATTVWSFVRRFDRPQVYKHFIRSCALKDSGGGGGGGGGGDLRPGCLRELSVITGLPASTSMERLDLLDDAQRAIGFTNIGGDHRLRNYRSVTTVDEIGGGDGEEARKTVVLESYVVDVPEGNTVEDTTLFTDTVVRLNLQNLASVAEASRPPALN